MCRTVRAAVPSGLSPVGRSNVGRSQALLLNFNTDRNSQLWVRAVRGRFRPAQALMSLAR